MRHESRSVQFVSFLFACLFIIISIPAKATVLTFEGLPDNLSLSNEFSGLTFNGATVLTAGLSLNEFDFPPISGDNVVVSLTNLLEITFLDLTDTVSGYFTYGDLLSLSSYDINGRLLATSQSAGVNNLGSNELITLSGQGISLLRVSSNSNFTLDDLSFSNAVAVPEPTTIVLLAIGALGLRMSRCNRNRCE